VTGTAGPDVIVSNGALEVYGAGGADFICVTGSETLVRVYAGDGDDLVDTTAASGLRVTTILDFGADTFLGGSVKDVVYAETPSTDAEVDNIATGAGDDMLISGVRDDINRDVLSGGPGDDKFRVRGLLRAPGAVRPGGPHNRLYYSIGGDTAVDLRARTVTIDGHPVLTWHAGRIDHITTGSGGRVVKPGDTLTFSGTKGSDVLTLLGDYVLGSPRVTAHLLSGNDSVEAPDDGFAAGSTFSAGRGHDTLVVNLRERHGKHPLTGHDAVAIDLAAHTLLAEGVIDTDARISGFDEVRAGGIRSLVVRGDNQANTVLAVGCQVQVDGRDGDDVLQTDQPHACQSGKRHLDGGPGNDRVIGGELADVLVGGPGRDAANGRGGNDSCRAEVSRNCEH
jgi:Ca2+-binding RTX toxin-like protein